MDFAGFNAIDTRERAEEGVRVPFKRLDGTPLLNAKGEPCGLIMLGADSATYRRAVRAAQRARVDRLQAGEAPLSDEMLDADLSDATATLVACTAGWFGILDSKGEELPFSPAGARELMEAYPVARAQADDAVGDRRRFTKTSSDA